MGIRFWFRLWLWFRGGCFALRDAFGFRCGVLFGRCIVRRGLESAHNDSPGAADVLALVPFVAALGFGLGFAGAAGMFAYSKNAGVEGTCLMLRAWRRYHLGLRRSFRRAWVWLWRGRLSRDDLSHIISTYRVALAISGVLAL